MTPVRVIAAIVLAALAAPHCALWAASPESGSYIFQHYTPDQYNAAPENWAAAQDPRGLMYFANTNALLEFDGQSWRAIRLSNSSVARSVAVDKAGSVYVGGVGVFGVLRPDRNGVMQFVSLADKVPEADRQFSDIWRVLPTPEGIYFTAYERLFRLNPDGSLRVWRPASNFGRAVTIHDALYVKTREAGLMKMVDDTLVPVPGGGIFKKIGVTSASSLETGGLIATPSGLFRLNAAGIEPFLTAADAYFAEKLLYTTYVFPDGEIAAGTRHGGLVLLNPDGTLDRILTRESGLSDEYVAAIFRDRQGGVWLAGSNGLTYLNPGLTRFSDNLGLEGHVWSVGRAKGTVYAGTTKGLFRMTPAAGREPVFSPVPGIATTAFVLLEHGGTLLAGTDGGLFAVSAGHAAEIVASEGQLPVNDIAPSLRDPSLIYTAGVAGVLALRQNGSSWKKTAGFAPPGQSFTSFNSVREDADGSVWATTNDAIWRIHFDGDKVTTDSFGEAQGIPAGAKNARSFAGHTVFATPKGMMRYSATSRRFESDNEFGPQFADGSRDVFDLFDDTSGNVWITGEHYHGVLLRQAGGYKWLNAPLLGAAIRQIYQATFDGDGTAWVFGASGVLYRWEQSLYGNPDENLHVVTRRIGTVSGNRTIYGGAGNLLTSRLPHRDNALRFEFAAPFSEQPSAVEYQTMLEGDSGGWSEWSHGTNKEYSNLFEGSYKFHVRARSPHGTVVESAALVFGIFPPWYRTWWAYSIYLALLGVAVWGIVGWRTRQLVEEKQQLEQIVEERTVEIREQRDEIHRQERQGHSLLLNILPETVAEELKTNGSVRPVGFDDVTVCFTDFVGFTLSSEKLSPERLVEQLNQYFTAFDEIVARYGLEKLKTIGDSYMFASGLPARRAAHAVDAVLAALEMVEVVKHLAPVTGWDIRIGLHSGPVVAGVVGIRKFAFDIWGNTVNLASRMESSGVPGRVNLSERTYELTRGLVECEARGQIHTKDGRDLPMYLVKGVAKTFDAGYADKFGGKPQAFRAVSS